MIKGNRSIVLFAVLILSLTLISSVAFAASTYSMTFNSSINSYYGSGSPTWWFDCYNEQDNVRGLSQNEYTETYIRMDNSSSGGNLGWQTQYDPNYLDVLPYISGGNTPSDARVVEDYNPSSVITTAIMYCDGNDYVDIFIPFKWLKSSGSYSWDDLSGSYYSSMGSMVDSSKLAPLANFTGITLSSNY